MCLLLLVVIALFTVETVAEKCTTPNNEVAECIYSSSCPVLSSALAAQDNVSVEFVRQSYCGETALEPMVCCGTLSNFSRLNAVEGSSNNIKNGLLPDRNYCGYQHSDDYTSAKNITAINEFPWLAALIYEHNNMQGTRCGGSLISNRYVLTSALCASPRSDIKLIKVRLGDYNVKNQTDCVENSRWRECSEPPQDFAIAKSIIHPQYNPRRLLNDIALLRLERVVNYSDYIRPICLPTPETQPSEVGDVLTTTGWGQRTFNGEQAEIKKRILGRLIGNAECITADKRFKEFVTENNFCAIELDSNTDYSCLGDSGGPAMISPRKQWQQEGILSFGVLCHAGYPQAYTKVARYFDWIKENIEP